MKNCEALLAPKLIQLVKSLFQLSIKKKKKKEHEITKHVSHPPFTTICAGVDCCVRAYEINMTRLKKCFGEETVAAVSTRYILDAC